MPTRDAIRGPAVVFFLSALAVILTAGCIVSIEESNKTGDGGKRQAESVAAAPLPSFDVAISAVDFDPPLSRDVPFDAQHHVKLMAAVENKGTMQLSKLVVVARLASQRGDFSTQDRVNVDSLSPGETRVVEFDAVAPPADALPRSRSFSIKVSVEGPQLDSSLPKPTRELVVRVAGQ